MIVTKYYIKEIGNYEEFLNKLFIGLKHYEKAHNTFKFKMTYTKDYIELTSIKLPDGSSN